MKIQAMLLSAFLYFRLPVHYILPQKHNRKRHERS